MPEEKSKISDKQREEIRKLVKDYFKTLGIETNENAFTDEPLKIEIVDDDGNVKETIYR